MNFNAGGVPIEENLLEKPADETPPPAEKPVPEAEKPAPEVEKPEPVEPELTPEQIAMKEEVDRRLAELDEKAKGQQGEGAAPFDEDGDFHFKFPGRKDPWVIPTTEDGKDLYHPTFASATTPEAKEYIAQHGKEQWEAVQAHYETARSQYRNQLADWGSTTQAPKAHAAFDSGLDLIAKMTALEIGTKPDEVAKIVAPLVHSVGNHLVAETAKEYVAAGYSEKQSNDLAVATLYAAYGENLASELFAQAVRTPQGFGEFIKGIAALAGDRTRVKDPALGVVPPAAAEAAAAAARSAAASGTLEGGIDAATGEAYTPEEAAAVKSSMGYRPGDEKFMIAVKVYRKHNS